MSPGRALAARVAGAPARLARRLGTAQLRPRMESTSQPTPRTSDQLATSPGKVRGQWETKAAALPPMLQQAHRRPLVPLRTGRAGTTAARSRGSPLRMMPQRSNSCWARCGEWRPKQPPTSQPPLRYRRSQRRGLRRAVPQAVPPAPVRGTCRRLCLLLRAVRPRRPHARRSQRPTAPCRPACRVAAGVCTLQARAPSGLRHTAIAFGPQHAAR